MSGAQGQPESASKHEFVSPQASPQARAFITKGRSIMYDPGMDQAVRAAITGGKDLATGVATYVVHLIAKLEEKMGQLSDDDYQMVLVHLCGSMVDLAKELGDPAAQNTTAAVKECIQLAMQMHQQEDNRMSQQPDPNADPNAQDPSQAPPMAQFGGAPQMQGPPQ